MIMGYMVRMIRKIIFQITWCIYTVSKFKKYCFVKYNVTFSSVNEIMQILKHKLKSLDRVKTTI